ncbi:ankyrin repeat-containing protein At5g02620-like [Neltuma alba]|uniref:ankyrin repeat-containing protein At5g02620-like n=1 Tax=Neltuma alba TaxID=207710 RepID=UPI0010A3DAE3|nr:ankyrin repeat-containing protein At5g02620-like [Prosopis alba]
MEIAHHHHHEEENMKALYEASYQGSVSILNTLIQNDPLILHRISSQTIFVETPLHISALLGHLEFLKTLLTHKPKLTLELNSFQSTALHLASAEGHVEIVKELLLACDEACLFCDQQGRIPLHYAVMRGRFDVVIELIRAKPESLRMLHKGNTIFHLCVIYNRLKILKALMESDTTHTYELLSSRDLDGNNTILHLAVMFKQVEIVGYLLSVPEIREVANLVNCMGYTAHDIVKRIPQDLKSLEIELIFMNTTCIKRDEKKRMENAHQTPITDELVFDQAAASPKEKRRTKKIFKCMGKWFKHNGGWLEEMRGNLSLVATVIATMTFQVAINPPGSFIQQGLVDSNAKASNNMGPLDCFPLTKDNDGSEIYKACPGEAMLASRYPYDFRIFVIYNTISFVASLGVTLLLVSGVPLKNKVVMWTLCIGMCITLTSLALTYFNGLLLISPYTVWDSTVEVYSVATWTWVALLGVVGLYIIVGVVIWAVKKCIKIVKHCMSVCQRNKNENGCCLL